MTPQDLDLATRTVLAEAGSQGLPGMVAVANVLKNRVGAGKWGDNLSAVTTAKSQFEPMAHWGTGTNNDPARYSTYSPEYQQAARIVSGVMAGQIPDITNGATHFYAPVAQASLGRTPPEWASGSPTAKIGGHVFFNPDGNSSPTDPNAATPGTTPSNISLPSTPADNPTAALGAAGPATGAPAAPAAAPAAGLMVPPKPSANAGVAFGQGLFGNMFGQHGTPTAAGTPGAPAPGQAAAPQGGILGRMLFGDGGLHGAMSSIPTPNGGQGLFGGMFPHNPALPGNPDGLGANGAAPISIGQPPAQPPGISMGTPSAPPAAPISMGQPQGAGAPAMPGAATATGANPLAGLFRSLFGG